MRLIRLGLSLFGVIAIFSAILAGAIIWLLLTDPVTVADAVTEGQVTPVIRELALVLYGAILGLLRYL
jgi:hypothetical protein